MKLEMKQILKLLVDIFTFKSSGPYVPDWYIITNGILAWVGLGLFLTTILFVYNIS